MILFGLCALGFALGKVQNAARDGGRPDVLSNFVQTLTIPVSRPTGALSVGSGEFFYGLTRARRLSIENQRLYDRLAATAMYTEQSTRLQREIDNLRALLALPPVPGKQRVAADIVGFFPKENRMTLSVGTAQGVKVGMPVVAASGLVGTVQTVAANRAQVLLLTTTSLKIGAIVLNRNPSPTGIMSGENASTLTLPFTDPKAPVQIGDVIATSGLSEYIPRGIPIGRVIQVQDDEAFGRRVATVDPFVSPGELREVVVLK